MKRLSTFLLVAFIFLSSISAQVKTKVAPQKIYCGATNCTAVLPDYRPKISATDNCELAALTQVPAPGLVLSNKQRATNVTVKATDASGNATSVSFSVTLIDTIKPVLIINPSLTTVTLEQIDRMYDIADRSMNYMMEGISKMDTIKYPMAKYWQDSVYWQQNLVVWTSPGHAYNGKGGRWWTFGTLDTACIKQVK